MNEYAPLFVISGIAIIFGFAISYQNHGFLKEDVKYLEKRIREIEKEIFELKYRR